MATTDSLGRVYNRSSPEGWDILSRLASQREAIEEAIRMLDGSPDPRAVMARLRLARA